jgi:hypothetical protein
MKKGTGTTSDSGCTDAKIQHVVEKVPFFIIPGRGGDRPHDRHGGKHAGHVSDVLLGVVGSHLLLLLLLVDVLLEDIAQHIRVDLVVRAQGTLVQMPSVAVEEVEQPLERLVGDRDLRVVLLQAMDVEQSAVHVRDGAQQVVESFFPLGGRLVQSFVEQPQQEVLVERVEPVLAVLLHGLHPMAQIIPVVVQEAFLLDEVHEHQPVKHQRGVPGLVVCGRDALDELQERGVFGLEPVVEPLGDAIDIERGPRPANRLLVVLVYDLAQFPAARRADGRAIAGQPGASATGTNSRPAAMTGTWTRPIGVVKSAGTTDFGPRLLPLTRIRSCAIFCGWYTPVRDPGDSLPCRRLVRRAWIVGCFRQL